MEWTRSLRWLSKVAVLSMLRIHVILLRCNFGFWFAHTNISSKIIVDEIREVWWWRKKVVVGFLTLMNVRMLFRSSKGRVVEAKVETSFIVVVIDAILLLTFFVILDNFLRCRNEDRNTHFFHDRIRVGNFLLNDLFDWVWNLNFLVLNNRVRSIGWRGSEMELLRSNYSYFNSLWNFDFFYHWIWNFFLDDLLHWHWIVNLTERESCSAELI